MQTRTGGNGRESMPRESTKNLCVAEAILKLMAVCHMSGLVSYPKKSSPEL